MSCSAIVVVPIGWLVCILMANHNPHHLDSGRRYDGDYCSRISNVDELCSVANKVGSTLRMHPECKLRLSPVNRGEGAVITLPGYLSFARE